MRRRDFVTLLGGAAAWPLAARAQKRALPVIGYLSSRTPRSDASRLAAFRRGLATLGFVENENISIEYRYADGQFDKLPALASDLVHLNVAVIFAGSGLDAPVAKAATTTIPIVFNTAADPVQSGLIASLSRPGGNLTGVVSLSQELGPKRLELLHEMVPAATTIALLVNPSNFGAGKVAGDIEAAATSLGVQLHVFQASTERDFDAVFANLTQRQAGALLIGTDAFFTGRREQLAELSVHHGVPAIYATPEFTAAGGLMSYGGSITDLFHTAGVYVGRVLKGEKPSDLPVQQATKVELIINLKTAKALGITVPITLLGRADEVIE